MSLAIYVIAHQLSTKISFSGSTTKLHFLNYFFSLKFVHFLVSCKTTNSKIILPQLPYLMSINEFNGKYNPQSKKYEGTV